MPNAFVKLFKLSLLSGLFVFIDLSCFNRCFYLLCFTARNIELMFQHGLNKSCYLEKSPHFLCYLRNTASKLNLFAIRWTKTLHPYQKPLKYTLQKIQLLKKLLNYCLKVLKSNLNNQKSYQKQSKAIKIYSTRLLFQLFQVGNLIVFHLNPML